MSFGSNPHLGLTMSGKSDHASAMLLFIGTSQRQDRDKTHSEFKNEYYLHAKVNQQDRRKAVCEVKSNKNVFPCSQVDTWVVVRLSCVKVLGSSVVSM